MTEPISEPSKLFSIIQSRLRDSSSRSQVTYSIASSFEFNISSFPAPAIQCGGPLSQERQGLAAGSIKSVNGQTVARSPLRGHDRRTIPSLKLARFLKFADGHQNPRCCKIERTISSDVAARVPAPAGEYTPLRRWSQKHGADSMRSLVMIASSKSRTYLGS